MEVKLFVRDDCAECPEALRRCAAIDVLSVYDVGEAAGMAEASAWRVESVPTVIVVDASGRELATWHGMLPSVADLKALLAN